MLGSDLGARCPPNLLTIKGLFLPMHISPSINGACLCGNIAFAVRGKLKNARSCHCSQCRKAFSSQASAYALVHPEEFTWTRGKHLLTAYESKSGSGLLFCSQCGSTLVGTADGIIHGVTLGCIDGDTGVEIEAHIFVDSKASWEILPEGIKAFSGAAPQRE